MSPRPDLSVSPSHKLSYAGSDGDLDGANGASGSPDFDLSGEALGGPIFAVPGDVPMERASGRQQRSPFGRHAQLIVSDAIDPAELPVASIEEHHRERRRDVRRPGESGRDAIRKARWRNYFDGQKGSRSGGR